ncbi:ABC transporter substrate-binding protein [Pseudodesulfovibrio indicus]|uniref:Amino acid/amide ABC transporter substrate-binding protein (HAAT family) n=2 Tax=Pseudodesulfovibrio indicus TaxID=1716143 RepID=A0AA94PNU8_9BACT|nr:ABC transporter substrate-binding protein [Pseudodesulfovibrio indicus]TDT89786.1 amino acid/amide ABC transporter substrate-binding protein (HAAT family) [Pseudodesulfovibrio indicus]
MAVTGIRPRETFVRIVGLSLMLSILALAVFASSEASAANPVRIAMITAKTGEAGPTNSLSFEAARYSVNVINGDRGILGRPVELLEYDNQSTPEGSAEAARQALADGAVAVVGCNWSSHSLAMAEVLQKARIPMITHMSTNPAVTWTGDYIFRACFTDELQGAGLAHFAGDKLRAKTAVILVDRGRTYSKGLAKSFAESFEAEGGAVLWTAEYDSGNLNPDMYLENVSQLDPDLLFVPGGYADVAAFFGRTARHNVRAARMSGDGISVKLYSYIGELADGVYFSGHWNRWVNTRLSREFVREYEKESGKIRENTQALVYDSFMLLREAMEWAGTTDGPEVRDALFRISGFEGVTGEITFDRNGDPIKPLTINQLRYGGLLYLEQVHP